MKKRKLNVFKVRRRISDCKRRLDNLKKQGFHFSQEIYYDLDGVKDKILQASLMHRMWNKKIQVFTSLISLFVFILFLYLLLFQNEMNIEVTNVYDDMIIDKNFYETFVIKGTASYQNKWIPYLKIEGINSVQMKTNNNLDWKPVNGTDNWDYFLNVYNMPVGLYNFSFRCINGDGSLVIKKNGIQIIDTRPPNDTEPTVSINNPFPEEKNLSGIVTITGDAYSEFGDIKQVKVQFNEAGQWFNATTENIATKTIWKLNWNTKKMKNGNLTISAKSYDDNNQSKIFKINVTVNNTDRPFNFYSDGPFNFYIHEKYETDLLKPGMTYTIKGYHNASEETGFKRWKVITSFIKVQGQAKDDDWLNIMLPADPIVTPRDGLIYNFSINISITNKAPMDTDTVFSIYWTYTTPFWTHLYENYPRTNPLIDITNGHPLDITIYTGNW